MNILYGIQGTGHGHISRAKELLPALSKYASLDVLISGGKNRISVDREVRFHKKISLSYNRAGGVSILKTLQELRPISLINDISSISLDRYNLIISDYEPISAWSAKLENVPSLGLSHQAAFLSDKTSRPAYKSQFAETVLKHFAPTNSVIGFSLSTIR
ncbi:glycosyltransferase family protein [Fodinibius sp. AD559]|uniref:glycosyltransferase family protein n=1 Tax=Fodinibius sp. AD559 TaxID=3424179 RepID=UPI0040469DFC